MLSHQLFALLLIVCTLLFVGVNGLEPAWCSPWKQQQQQTTYSLCEKHNGKDLTDELQGVASWYVTHVKYLCILLLTPHVQGAN